MYTRDTIAAICTPAGEGGIGIVRISGDDAAQVGATIFTTRKNGGYPSHRFCYGTVTGLDGQPLDEGFAVLMKAPNSYTREDVFEIQCHGGTLVTRKVLELALASGARLAAPGEFTKRAFLNGRIDLLQAEAVMDLIRSKTDTALKLAEHQREGLLSKRLTIIRDAVRETLALVEAHIDFPDEDIELPLVEEMTVSLAGSLEKLAAILSTYREGKVLRDGVSVAIAGKPNVGKSSLLNTLLREERAIVTETPGTTRDVIEEVLNIEGLAVRLLDTAGIRETSDTVERMGIDRALGRIALADLVLFVLDRSTTLDDDDLRIFDAVKGLNILLVRNKSDLPEQIALPDSVSFHQTVDISTRSGTGIAELKHQILRTFISGDATDSREFTALSQARHHDAIMKAREALERALNGLIASELLEILAVDLRDALYAIGEVTGETTPDDVLELVFSRFCIGK